MRCSGCNGSFVSRICVARDANAGIIRENALETLAHLRSSVGDNHLTCMKRIADSNATTVVE